MDGVPSTWQLDDEPVSLAPAPSEPVDEPDEADADKEDLEGFQYPFAIGEPLARKLVVGEDPNHTLVEQFRHLAAALHHAQLRTGARRVMVASAVEAEGKTMTAVNLALTLSHSHKRRVLLVDADLRRPSVHTILQLNNREGLSEALKNIDPNAALPLHHISPTLSVLTAGTPTQDPMSALVSDMMREFMREASERFDWVILDTPPIALLSDANLLSAMIDFAILVVGANTTPYPMSRRAVEAIGAPKLLGVVLNRARHAELSIGYRYYYYAYGASSYTPRQEPTGKKSWWRLPFRRKASNA